jgi:hypothetical protein
VRELSFFQCRALAIRSPDHLTSLLQITFGRLHARMGICQEIMSRLQLKDNIKTEHGKQQNYGKCQYWSKSLLNQ